MTPLQIPLLQIDNITLKLMNQSKIDRVLEELLGFFQFPTIVHN